MIHGSQSTRTIISNSYVRIVYVSHEINAKCERGRCNTLYEIVLNIRHDQCVEVRDGTLVDYHPNLRAGSCIINSKHDLQIID